MTGNTSLGIPYPQVGDSVAAHTDMQALAEGVNSLLELPETAKGKGALGVITAAANVYQDVPGAAVSITNPHPTRAMITDIWLMGYLRSDNAAINLAARFSGSIILASPGTGILPNALYMGGGAYICMSLNGQMTVPAGGTVTVTPQACRQSTAGTVWAANFVTCWLVPRRFA